MSYLQISLFAAREPENIWGRCTSRKFTCACAPSCLISSIIGSRTCADAAEAQRSQVSMFKIVLTFSTGKHVEGLWRLILEAATGYNWLVRVTLWIFGANADCQAPHPFDGHHGSTCHEGTWYVLHLADPQPA